MHKRRQICTMLSSKLLTKPGLITVLFWPSSWKRLGDASEPTEVLTMLLQVLASYRATRERTLAIAMAK